MERTDVKSWMAAKGVPYWAVYFGVTREEIDGLPWYNAPMDTNEPKELLSHQLITRYQEDTSVPETNKEEQGTPTPDQEGTSGSGPESTKEKPAHRAYRGRAKNRT